MKTWLRVFVSVGLLALIVWFIPWDVARTAIVKMLDNLSEEEIAKVNIPTAMPLLYELDAKLQPVSSRYLGDAEAVKARAEAVARQAEAKK